MILTDLCLLQAHALNLKKVYASHTTYNVTTAASLQLNAALDIVVMPPHCRAMPKTPAMRYHTDR